MLGNGPAAADLLRDLPARLLAIGSDDPTAILWPDTIEALVEAGEPAPAQGVFAQWLATRQPAGRAVDGRHHSPLQRPARRCRQRRRIGASAAFDESLAALDGYTYPLERARTLLCLGTVLRQANKRCRCAGQPSKQALAIFDELGGVLWAEKARAELARISGRRPPSETLTETEHQVATLAGQGQSNKEIATSLHMGVSTVEAHLSSVYRKLDVRRAGLASAARRRSVSAMRHAVLVVLGDHDVGRVDRARGALGVAQHLVGAERLLERVVREEAAGE